VAYVSGFIESFYAYQGHHGIERRRLREGPNDFMSVDKVLDAMGQSVPAPSFVKVYAGAGAPGDSRDMHSILIDVDGNVYTAGNNNMGQLCHGDLVSRDVFQQIDSLPGPAIMAAVGLDFTLILLDDGRVYGCGSNENGEMGLGSNVQFTTTPTTNGLKGITEISTGLSFSLYLQGGSGADNERFDVGFGFVKRDDFDNVELYERGKDSFKPLDNEKDKGQDKEKDEDENKPGKDRPGKDKDDDKDNYRPMDTGKVFGSGSNLFSQLCESTAGDPVDRPMVSGHDMRDHVMMQ